MDYVKRVETIVAWCILGPILAAFVLALSPLLVVAWANEYLTTKDMTPEELKRHNNWKKFLSSGGWS